MALEALHDDQINVEKKNTVPQKQEHIVSKETPIDQQKFIENKFIRLDSVYKKEKSRVTYSDAEPTVGGVLVTKRGDVSFHIEKDWAGGRNAEITITDSKNTYKILLDTRDESPDRKYTMTVLQNGKAVSQKAANAIATKYIGML